MLKPIVLLSLLFTASGHAQARQVPPPARTAAPTYVISGFRAAHFGMSEGEARAAIAQDFPAAAITEASNPAEGTRALKATLDRLEPGPGAATVVYIFGASSHRLTHINVLWSLPGEATAEQRDAIVTAALQLTNYFQHLPVTPKAISSPHPVGTNALLFYAAIDARDAAMELAATGIALKAGNADTTGTPPPPTGPATLRISYSANAANPDVKRTKPGTF